MAASVEALTEAYPYMRLTVVFASYPDKDLSGVLAELEPVADTIVVTRNSSQRSADTETVAAIATEIFGADRVRVAERLDDAIDLAVGLADEAAEEDLPGRSGVLITGSVIAGRNARQACLHRRRLVMRRLCSTVLGFEAVIIALAIVPTVVLGHVSGGLAGGIGGGLAIAALLIAGFVGRPGMGWALIAGSVLQLVIIAAGAALPAMYVLGVIFAALWITGIWLARKWEQPTSA
jgi:hypothetical protein